LWTAIGLEIANRDRAAAVALYGEINGVGDVRPLSKIAVAVAHTKRSSSSGAPSKRFEEVVGFCHTSERKVQEGTLTAEQALLNHLNLGLAISQYADAAAELRMEALRIGPQAGLIADEVLRSPGKRDCGTS
jgi:hypothetical protein